MSNLKEGEDYYLNEDGFLVFTAAHHLKRGSCCGNGCLHCPYKKQQSPINPPPKISGQAEGNYLSEEASPNPSKGGGLS